MLCADNLTGESTMKLNELAAAFEQYKIDADAQMKQLRRELYDIQRKLTQEDADVLSDKQQSTKQADIEFGEEVMRRIKGNNNHPFIKDRDIYTTWHMHIVITSVVRSEVSKLNASIDSMLGHDSSARTKNELRVMCNRLVNSGIFITRKAQRYIPAMPEYGQTPSRRRQTVVIVNNFDKYKNMTESQIYAQMKAQESVALANNREMMQAEAAKSKTTELDSDVSFL